MSSPRFLADHDLSKHIIDGVLEIEPLVHFVRAFDLGLARKADALILQYASEHSLIVVTHDAKTMPKFAYERMAQGLPMSGVLVAKQTQPVREAIDSLVLIWSPSDAA